MKTLLLFILISAGVQKAALASNCTVDVSSITTSFNDDQLNTIADLLTERGYEISSDLDADYSLNINKSYIKGSQSSTWGIVSYCDYAKYRYEYKLLDNNNFTERFVNGQFVEVRSIVSKYAGPKFKSASICVDRSFPTSWLEDREEALIDTISELPRCN